MSKLSVACIFAIWAVFSSVAALGQAVSSVSGLLTFRESGSISRGFAPVPTVSGNDPKVSTSLIKVSSGQGAAASLVLGSLGSARMEGESEVQVPAAAGDSRSLEMLKGKLFLNINAEELAKRGKGEFRLKTPAALLAVKGTKFFVISTAAGDVIGVLEGRVTVYDSHGSHPVSISTGQAVEVAADVISAPRALTPEEAAYQAQVALAEVVRTPLALVVEKPFDQKAGSGASALLHLRGKTMELSPAAYAAFKASDAAGPYLRWQGWAGEIPSFEGEFNAAATKPNPAHGEAGVGMLPDGMLSYTWNWSRNNEPDRHVEPQSGSLARFDLYPHDSGQRALGECIGIEFEAAGQAIEKVAATTGSGGFMFGMPKSGRLMAVLKRPATMKLESAALTTPAGSKRNDVERSMIWMTAYPFTTTAAATKSVKDDVAGFSVGGFVMLTLPK